jgi:hypothetical protein
VVVGDSEVSHPPPRPHSQRGQAARPKGASGIFREYSYGVLAHLGVRQVGAPLPMQATACGRIASFHLAVALPVSIHRHEGWVALAEVMVWRTRTPVVIELEEGRL